MVKSLIYRIIHYIRGNDLKENSRDRVVSHAKHVAKKSSATEVLNILELL